MGMIDRLKEVMELKGLNIKTFAEQLDVPYRTLQNYLLHSRDPSVEILIKVSDMLNVDLNWLMRGQGNMFCNSLNTNELTKKEQLLIDHYRRMPRYAQMAFDVSFRLLVESNN